MNKAKPAIAAVNPGTLALVVLGLAALEIPLRTVTLPGTLRPLVFLGIFRVLEGALITGMALSQKPGLSILGLIRGELLSGFRRGLLWSAGFGGFVFVAFVFSRAMGIDPLPFIKIHLPLNPGEAILFFLVGGIISPLTEELFFRGILYGFLRRWGAGPAILISSLAFVSAHGSVTGYFFVLLTGGIMFAVAYEIEKNLMVPLTLHVLGNLALFTLSSLNS